MTRVLVACLCLFCPAVALGQDAIVAIDVDPPVIRLDGPGATYTLLVTGKTASGTRVDLTRSARYRVMDGKLATVAETGTVRARADGTTRLVIEAAGRTRTVDVRTTHATAPRAFHFENDIVPLLSRFGCNSAGCHGNAEGQNGFKLSVFGFDPAADHAALVKEARGRRILPAAPDASLFLAKASGRMPHGGGVRIPPGTPEYDTLRAWIAAGAPFGDPAAPRVAAVRVEPRERALAMKGRQQLRVIARYTDGRETDVTALAKFQTNSEALASVAADGLVSAGETPGEVAVMASYHGAVDTFRAVIPRPGKIDPYPPFPAANFIDTHVLAKLKKLNIAPSDLADDATFLRRVYLDVVGTLPTPAEARRFLADTRPDRRAKLVDELLDRPEFADYWALKWADVLRVDRSVLGHKRAYGLYRWIRDSLAANKPYDRFVCELLTAEGPLDESAPAAFSQGAPRPGEAASSLAQIFLGVRIACAECHHHPFDRWSQTDYYGMQAFFAQLAVKAGPRGEFLLAGGDPVTKHPRTGAVVPPHALGVSPPAKAPAGDRRLVLAVWLTAPDNPWFARNLANRTWAHFFSKGIIDPVDDVRDTNPPTNPELLDALAKHVVDSKFDVKQLIRTITASRTYQLSSKPNVTNEKDASNFSRAYFRRIDAEVLLDMVSQTTGVAERFNGAPPGTRAIQLWDSKINHYFLKLFGRPQRVTACECERVHEPSVSQVLHLLNSPDLQDKLSHAHGTVARLVQTKTQDAELVNELYLTFYSRLPTDAERQASLEHLRGHAGQRRQAAEDLAWTMMNTVEFVFNR
jgi:hypothetical protein